MISTASTPVLMDYRVSPGSHDCRSTGSGIKVFWHPELGSQTYPIVPSFEASPPDAELIRRRGALREGLNL